MPTSRTTHVLLLLSSTLLFAFAWLPQSARGSIQIGAHEVFEFSGHYYGLTLTKQSWTDSETEAIDLGGHLVAVNSAAEQAFLESMFVDPVRSTSAPLWIGLNDVDQKGLFEWSSGESLSYTNWKSGEPNNTAGQEHYVAMNWEYGRGGPLGTWNDTPDAGSQVLGIFDRGTIGPYQGIIELTELPANLGVPEPLSFVVWLALCCCVSSRPVRTDR